MKFCRQLLSILLLVSILIGLVPMSVEASTAETVSAQEVQSAVRASAPAISSPFTTHPAVFMVEDTYQISFATDTTGYAWVEVGGKKYNDATSGLMDWNVKYHKITVPQSALNSAKSYKICFRSLTERPAYDPVPGSTVSRTYPFTPAPNNPVLYCASDQHGDQTYANKIAGYQSFDVYVIGGDYTGTAVADTDLKKLLDIAGDVTKGTKPVIYSRGNHEIRGAYSNDLYRLAPTNEKNGMYYTISMANVFGIVLDGGEDKSDAHEAVGGSVDFEAYRKEQTQWLRELLASREWEKYPVRIAFCHIPMSFYNSEDFQAVYKDWTLLLNQMGISLMISGHSHNSVLYAPTASRYKYAANYSTIVVSDRENGDYTYSATFVSVKDQKIELKTITHELAVKLSSSVPIVQVPAKSGEAVEYTTVPSYKAAAPSGSVPALKDPFTRHPTVFAVDDNYEIVFSTNTTGYGWVEVGGVKYTDSTGGLKDWNTLYHKVVVPRLAVDAAKSYKICFQSVSTRAAYYPEHGSTVSLTYPFKPVANKENPTILGLSDCYDLTDEAQNVTKYQDFDILFVGGDYTKKGDSEANVTTLLDITSAAVSGTKPVIYTRGNREIRGSHSYLLEEIAPSESHYVVKLPDTYAIVLDSGEDKVDSDAVHGGTVCYEQYRNEQTEWLKQVVASGDWKNYPTRIAFCHMTFTTVGTSAFKAAYAEWTELLDQMGVSLVICGSNRVFSLIKPTTSQVSKPSFSSLVVSEVGSSNVTYSGSFITIGRDNFTIKHVSSAKKLLTTVSASNLTAKNYWNNSDKYLMFDFTNDSVAHERYESSVYGELNFDTPWASDGNTATSAIELGALTFSPKADSTSTTVGLFSRPIGAASGQWEHGALHYMPKSTDYCQVRLKIEGAVAATSDGQAKFRLSLDCPNDLDDSADGTIYWHDFYASFNLAEHVDKGYFTLEIPLTAAQYMKMNWVKIVHPAVLNIKSATGKTAKVSIDYIYIGPKETFPQQSDSLFFDFTNTQADRDRYDSHTYNYTNFDNPGNWILHHGTPIFTVSDGALHLNIPSKATSTSYSAWSRTYDPIGLHYVPHDDDYMELRLKIENAVSTASDGKINLSMTLDRSNKFTNASGTTRSWTFINVPIASSNINNGYFVLTTKLTDAEYLASDWITSIKPVFENIKPASGKVDCPFRTLR